MVSKSVTVVLAYFFTSISLLHDRHVNLYERPKCELIFLFVFMKAKNYLFSFTCGCVDTLEKQTLFTNPSID